MSYDPYHANPITYERWLGEESRQQQSSRSSYHYIPQPNRPRTHSMAKSGIRTRSKQRWPPPPMVEDEIQSLSREHSPELSDLVEMEAQMRGAVDQTPILVEANPGVFARAAPPRSQKNSSHASSLQSKSSSESLEPRTPPNSATTNADRRYVWQPVKDIHIPVSYDDLPPEKPKSEKAKSEKLKSEKLGSGKKVDVARNEEPELVSDGKRRDAPVLDRKSPRQIPRSLSPLMTARDPSPYTYSPASTKSTSGSNVDSAGMLSPDAKYGNGQVKTRHDAWDANGSKNHYNRMRAQSANSMERPQSTRHTSWAGYPVKSSSPDLSRLTPTSSRPPYTWSTSNSKHESSDDSDVSPDEYKSRVKRTTRYSCSQSEHSRPSVAPRYDTSARRPRKDSQLSNSGSFDRLSEQDTRYLPTSMPTSAALPRSARRNTSPRPSVYPSPDHSPPPSPRPDSLKYGLGTSQGSKSKYNDRPSSPISFVLPLGRKPNPTPQPASPLPSPRLSQGSKFDTSDLTYSSKSSPLGIPLPKSRQASPLPSPTPDSPLRANARTDHQGFASKNRITVSSSESSVRAREASTPSIISSPGYLPSPNGSQRRAPPNLEPVAAQTEPEFKRRSYEAPRSPVRPRTNPTVPTSKSQLAFHEQCRHKVPTSCHDDWSSIPECPSLNVCPDCRQTIEDQGYKGRFISDPARASGQKIRCDISNGFVSLAWAQILRGLASIKLVPDLMAIEQDEQACPGKHSDMRNWYRVWEPESKRYLSDFMICACCARRIELLFPTLRSTVLHPLAGRHPSICDLRSDSHRFTHYLDTLAHTVTDADAHRRPPNLFAFVRLARRMADTRECLLDDQLLHASWHFPHHLPELTVCPECYDAIVAPRADAGAEVALAISATAVLSPHQGAVSCQLYSARMRAVFMEACARRDLGRLSNEVIRRVAVERDLQAKMARLSPEMREGEEAVALVREWKRWE